MVCILGPFLDIARSLLAKLSSKCSPGGSSCRFYPDIATKKGDRDPGACTSVSSFRQTMAAQEPLCCCNVRDCNQSLRLLVKLVDVEDGDSESLEYGP
ncbi:hypothetical protein MRB53_037168 [Persea americana]|nr:hypothetical protein MRB53_037168 [Persea americana]